MNSIDPSKQATATIDFSVSGMSCSGCSTTVQHALRNAPGVLSANVDLKSANASVEFDDAQTNPSALKELIDRLGYHCELAS